MLVITNVKVVVFLITLLTIWGLKTAHEMMTLSFHALVHISSVYLWISGFNFLVSCNVKHVSKSQTHSDVKKGILSSIKIQDFMSSLQDTQCFQAWSWNGFWMFKTTRLYVYLIGSAVSLFTWIELLRDFKNKSYLGFPLRT